MDNLNSPLPIWICIFFLSIAYLCFLSFLVLYEITVGAIHFYCLVTDPRGIWHWLGLFFYLSPLVFWDIFLLYLIFYHEGTLDRIKCFFCIYWNDHIPPCILWMCYIMFTELHRMGPSCISEMNPIWWWCMIFLICCWIQFANILLRIFTSVFIRWQYNFLLYYCLCCIIVIIIRIMLAS
jgi:hypothetical protein